ncbi:MAG: nicotinate-nucleotide--dimethylbenzimidazole phosphoribosyltransferase [Anaeromicrobium sp.]|jgi:nicotinate-nucleotide--dimethylbenzimidazole phosphoribosyltransferase|uniref:nicotinate-nucleotide--dimethylbenzimidazole phosphoribosyltransferase n=1 Tax=Anaeromicrobium sp. TaxID=1929132 RepID=UPI0025F93AE1|nr:nicotinate-nucleotide--dimethylbenzimidazole phosphoribosyltransferase [Anaeromicrobium sp.]MCT4595676.1 nicotinate-nucleotide--dimethylbenzimidazole phosphoribosyltransferase [Anaeromicrobium sp.]
MRKLQETINSITPLSKKHMDLAKERLDLLIKPLDSLGKLETIAIQLSGIYENNYYDTSNKLILGFGADHGVYEENVSPCKQVVTKQQFANFIGGGNGVSTLCKFTNSHVWAIDVGINCDEEIKGVFNEKIRKSTDNMRTGPAMTRDEAIKSLEIGIKYATLAKEKGYKVIGIGEMGICNTTPSTAIMSVFFDLLPENITGMGCGLDNEGIMRKMNVIKDSIKVNDPDKNDPIDILGKVGGFEIGAMAGAILGAASLKIPVVLDGFISYAAFIIAYGFNNLCKDYAIPSHMSAEPASKLVLDKLLLSPLLNLDMKLGEGSGAALAFNIIEAANFTYKNMITFDESNMENTHP